MENKSLLKIFAVVLGIFILYNIVYPYKFKYNLANIYLNIGQRCKNEKMYDLSNYFFTNAKKLTPNKIAWYDYNIATNLRSKYWGKRLTPYKKKSLQYAIKHLDSESKNFPDSLIITKEYAYIYYQLEDYDKSIEYFEKGLEKDQKWYYGYSILADIYSLAKQEYEKSNEYVDKALQLTNDIEEIDDLNFRKAFNYSGLDMDQEAIKYYELYLKNHPNSVAALVNITGCEISAKMYDKAEKHLERGLMLNRYSSYLLKSKVKLLIHKEKYDDAIQLIEEIISRDETDGYIAYNLRGMLEKKRGNYNEAYRYFDMAKKNAKEYYDKYCESNYELSDNDGNCRNRYEFLKDFDENIKKPIEL